MCSDTQIENKFKIIYLSTRQIRKLYLMHVLYIKYILCLQLDKNVLQQVVKILLFVLFFI